MKQYRQLTASGAAFLLGITLVLVLMMGWHREMAVRYPVADLPYVNMKSLQQQVEQGNVGRNEALYYRKDYAGADTTEIR
jgi:hypothetical protein